MVQGENLGVGPGRHQLLQHLAHIGLGLTHLAVKLAVGEGAGPPLAKLGIGFGIEAAGALPEAEGVCGAFPDRLAPLQQQGAEAHLGQQQGGEVTAGPRPHHHWTQVVGAGHGHGVVSGIGAGPQVGISGEALQKTCFSAAIKGQLQVEAVHQGDRLGLAGIDAALNQPQGPQLVRFETQPPTYRGPQIGLRVLEGQFQLAQSQHRQLLEARPGDWAP